MNESCDTCCPPEDPCPITQAMGEMFGENSAEMYCCFWSLTREG